MADEVNVLNMTDEELASFVPPEEEVREEVSEPVEEVSEPIEEVLEEVTEEVSEPVETEQEEVSEPITEEVKDTTLPDTYEGGLKADTSPSQDDNKEAIPKEAEIDYKAAYEEFMAPFKANGKEMTLDSIKDAKALMSMGANYNKKMQTIKPSLKIIKMLENNGLLDEGKLNYLIDLSKGNKGAIDRVVKESGIDPLDVGTEDSPEYTPNTYTVSDNQVELDDVILDIKDTPTFQTTMDVISNKWDEASKEILVKNPQVIKIINDQVESGIYEKIAYEVERERMLGRLTGVSDLVAYRQVGDAIQARGGFNTQPQAVQLPTEKPKEDPKLNAQRRAAGSLHSKPMKENNKPVIDILNMTDEEFSKLDMTKYI